MKKLLTKLSVFAIVAGVAMVIGDAAFAQTAGNGYEAGDSLYTDFTGNLGGTVGTTVGLGISLIGLYMWIWNQVSWGIAIAIGGALITAFPGIFDNLADGAKDAFKETVK